MNGTAAQAQPRAPSALAVRTMKSLRVSPSQDSGTLQELVLQEFSPVMEKFYEIFTGLSIGIIVLPWLFGSGVFALSTSLRYTLRRQKAYVRFLKPDKLFKA